jgi:hypothetical protein
MAIYELNSTALVQRCGKCAAENKVALDTLTVGVARDEQTDALVVPLPPCPACKSSEFLIRSADGEPTHPAPGSFGHLHRLLVDQVHAELVKRKRVLPSLKDKHGAVRGGVGKPVAATELKRWFPSGMKIAVREAEPTKGAAS